MTLEELLNCSAEQLEAMTEADYETHFNHYLNITRPERQEPKTVKATKSALGTSGNSKKFREAQALAAQFGLKI